MKAFIKKRIVLLFLSFLFSPLRGEVTYSFELPVLGQATLNGDLDFTTEKFSLSGTLTSKQAQFHLGPLIIDRPTITLSNTSGLGLSARGTLFDRALTFGIKEFKQKNRLVLGATFLTPPTLALGSQKIELNELDIALEESKPPLITATTHLFGKATLVTVGLDGSLSLKIADALPLATLDEHFAQTPLASLTIKNVSFLASNFLSSQENLAARIAGTIDISSLNLPGIPPINTALTVDGIFDKQNGVALKIDLDRTVAFGEIGSITNASLILFSQAQTTLQPFAQKLIAQKQKEDLPSLSTAPSNLILIGKGECTLPQLGTLAIEATSFFTKNSFNFSASILNKISVGPLSLSRATITLSSSQKSAALTGDGTIDDFGVNGTLNVNWGEHSGLFFEGKALNRSYQPFQSLQNSSSIEGQDQNLMRSLKLEDLTVKLAKNSSQQNAAHFELSLQGRCTIFNIALQTDLSLLTTPEGKKGIVLRATLPSTWKLSNAFPNTAFLDNISFKNASLIISSLPYFDSTLGVELDAGLSFATLFSMSDLVKELEPLAKNSSSLATLCGSISTAGKVSLSAAIPNFIPFKSEVFKGGALSVHISAGGQSATPSIALTMNITIKPTAQDQPLTFSAQIKPDPTEAKISGTMQGLWSNPLGLQGFSIGDLALQMSINYAQFSVTGLPSGAGIAGTIKIGSDQEAKTLSVAANITENLSDLFLLGKLQGTLSLRDLVELASKIAVQKILGSAEQTKQLATQITHSFENLLANKTLEPFFTTSIKNFELRYAPLGGRIGILTFERGLTLKGEVTLLGTKGSLNFTLDTSGLEAQGNLEAIKLEPLFSLTGALPGSDPSITLALNALKQEFIISGKISFMGISRLIDLKLTKDGLRGELDLNFYNIFDARLLFYTSKNISEPDFSINGSLKNNSLASLTTLLSRTLREQLSPTLQKLQPPKQKCDEMAAQLAELDEHMQNIEKSMQSLDPLSPELARLRFEYAGAKIKRFTLDSQHKAADFILQKTQDALGWTGELALKILDATPNFIGVNSFTLDTSLSELKAGLLPKAKIEISLFGIERTIHMQLDVSSQEKLKGSLTTLGQKIIDLFKPH